jgi:hypothetical protein
MLTIPKVRTRGAGKGEVYHYEGRQQNRCAPVVRDGYRQWQIERDVGNAERQLQCQHPAPGLAP